MRSYAALCPLLLLACSPQNTPENAKTNHQSAVSRSQAPKASATSDEYARVDKSFSDIPIDTEIARVQDRLTAIDTPDCFEFLECEWHDSSLVRHFFWTDGHDEPWLVVKSVRTIEVGDAPIAALAIGKARERSLVLSKISEFAPTLEFSCSKESSSERCDATVLPGWIRIWFDNDGSLTEVRFDGYHFT